MNSLVRSPTPPGQPLVGYFVLRPSPAPVSATNRAGWQTGRHGSRRPRAGTKSEHPLVAARGTLGENEV